MEQVKLAIQALSPEEWDVLYRWALTEERARREREAIKAQLIAEILSTAPEESAEETPVEEVVDEPAS